MRFTVSMAVLALLTMSHEANALQVTELAAPVKGTALVAKTTQEGVKS